MADFDQTLPAALAEANALDYDYNDGNGVDFEPYSEFQSADETASWIRAWTGNAELDGAEYRIFGQDGSGGYAAFWLVHSGRPLEQQPIVFFGSEGELGVVARNLDDYLWLLSGGFGPFEAVRDPDTDRELNMAIAELAARYAPAAEKPAREVIRLAHEEFPDAAPFSGGGTLSDLGPSTRRVSASMAVVTAASWLRTSSSSARSPSASLRQGQR